MDYFGAGHHAMFWKPEHDRQNCNYGRFAAQPEQGLGVLTLLAHFMGRHVEGQDLKDFSLEAERFLKRRKEASGADAKAPSRRIV